MFKSASCVSIAMLLVTLSGCSSKSSPVDPGPLVSIVVSGHPEWPPIMYRSGSSIDGAGAALVKLIFDGLDLRTSFPHTGTWDEVQLKAQSGEVDVLVAAYKTTAREAYMIYSDAYTTDPVAIYVARGKGFAFDNWDVLKGKKGVAMVGDSYGQQFDTYAAANLQLFRATTSAEAFARIQSGQSDYFLYALYAGDDHLKKAGTAAQFESLPKFVADEPFYVTISKKSPFVMYMPQINQAIAKYKADGTIAALIAHYKSK